MSPRTGRSPKNDARRSKLNIRLTEQEADLIQECADALNKTRTDTIMYGINLVKKEIDKKK